MGLTPVGFVRIAAVAFMTAELTMVFILGKFAVNVDLLVRSQRLHCTASPFTFRRGGSPWFALVGSGNFPCDLYQLFCVCVAGETVILFLCRLRRWVAEKQGNSKDQPYTYYKFNGSHGPAPKISWIIIKLINQHSLK
jgi:hypothetical protein